MVQAYRPARQGDLFLVRGGFRPVEFKAIGGRQEDEQASQPHAPNPNALNRQHFSFQNHPHHKFTQNRPEDPKAFASLGEPLRKVVGVDPGEFAPFLNQGSAER